MHNSLNSRYRLFFNLMMLFMVIRWLFFYYPAYQSSPHYETLRYALIGYIVFVAYIANRLAAAFGKKELVTNGLYKYVAHPSYTLYMVTDLIFLFWLTPFSILNASTSIVFLATILATAYHEELVLFKYYREAGREHVLRTLSVHSATAAIGRMVRRKA